MIECHEMDFNLKFNKFDCVHNRICISEFFQIPSNK